MWLSVLWFSCFLIWESLLFIVIINDLSKRFRVKIQNPHFESLKPNLYQIHPNFYDVCTTLFAFAGIMGWRLRNPEQYIKRSLFHKQTNLL